MEPQNFEKDFRDKLLEREISPSATSWDRLETKLVAGEEKKKNYYWWIGIAACITGAFFLLNQFYFVSTDPVSPQLVETPVEPEQTKEMPPVMEIPLIEETVLASEEPEEPAEVAPVKPQKEWSGTRERAVASAEKSTGIPGNNVETVQGFSGEEELIATKLDELIAEVVSKEENGEVTEAEIDALLEKAAAEIDVNRVSSTKTAGIDHRALLLEVEMEVERSFREKVLDLLREGYLRTRTAVANRGF